MTRTEQWRNYLHSNASDKLEIGKDKNDAPIYTFRGLRNLQQIRTHEQDEVRSLLTDWNITRRPDQVLARDSNYFALCGRRSGKSFMMMNEADSACMAKPGFKVAWLGPTFPMITEANIKGDSGFEQLMMTRGGFKIVGGIGRMSCEYENGSRIVFFSASNPSSIRGTGFNALYADEIAFWEHPQDSWNNATTILSQPYAGDAEMFTFASTTPPNPGEMAGKSMRAMPLIQSLWKSDKYVKLHFKTADNYFLLPSYLQGMRDDPLKDPRYFSVEFEAQMLDDNPFDLFAKAGKIRETREFVDAHIEHIVIGIDPATTSKRTSDNTGIVVAGRMNLNGVYNYAILKAEGTQSHVSNWSAKVIELYLETNKEFPNVPVHVYTETNQGGEAWSHILSQEYPPMKPYLYDVHVRGSKEERAQIARSLYERNSICWTDDFPELAQELHSFNPTMINRNESPGIMDAMTLAINQLVVKPNAQFNFIKAGF